MLCENSLSISISLLALTIAYPGAVLAQEAAQAQVVLEGITVVTASRGSAESVWETPTTVNVIDEKEIDTVKFTNSRQELLTRIPGNSMIRNMRIPDGSKNYTVNLVDGMAVGGFGKGQNVFVDQVNSWDIERVEIVKGAGSSLYGSNAIGGVINVITKEPPATPTSRIWSEAGSFDRYRGGASTGATVGSFGYWFDGNAMSIKGWQDRTAQEREEGSAKAVVTIDPTSKFTIRGEYVHTNVQDPGSLTEAQFNQNWRQASAPNLYSDQTMMTAITSYEKQISAQALLKVSYSMRGAETLGTASYQASGYTKTNEFNNDFVATYQRDFDFMRSKFITGVDLQYSDVEQTAMKKDAAGKLSWNSGVASLWDMPAQVGSPFAQFEISPIKPLRITAGARYDWVHYEGVGGDPSKASSDTSKVFTHLTPKIGATYELFPNLSLWSGYGQGFNVPPSSFLFSGGGANAANPSLVPETSESYEAGVRGNFFDKKLNYDVALYDTVISNMSLAEPKDANSPFLAQGCTKNIGCYASAGQVELKGVEAMVSYKAFDFLKFDTSYTYAMNQFIDYKTAGANYSGNYLAASPLHHLNTRATLTPIKNLDLEFELDKISSYYGSSDNSDPKGKYQRPDLFNVRASYDFGDYSLWIAGKNITNVKYADRISYSNGQRAYISGTPTIVYAGLSWKFGQDKNASLEPAQEEKKPTK
jgi:iron complex outermembrane receptor protein